MSIFKISWYAHTGKVNSCASGHGRPCTACKVLGEVLLGEEKTNWFLHVFTSIQVDKLLHLASSSNALHPNPSQALRAHVGIQHQRSVPGGSRPQVITYSVFLPTLPCQLSSFVSYQLRPSPKVMAWTPLPLHSISRTLTITKTLVPLLWALISS